GITGHPGCSLLQFPQCLPFRKRSAYIISLEPFAPVPDKVFELFPVLNAVADDMQLCAPGKLDHEIRQYPAFFPDRYDIGESLVQFHRRDRQFPQVIERRVSLSEIVESDPVSVIL